MWIGMMDMDVRHEAIRLRARAARRRSTEERERAGQLVERAIALGHGRRWLSDLRRQGTSRRLELETRMADDGVVPWPAISWFVEFDSTIVGRDLVIEDAKTLLSDRYGISRGDAFAILRHTSSRRNVKLREVARMLVASGVPGAPEARTG
jgi:ANTAR domain